ncbi:MAG: DUF1992 domain-containing protein, partial [Deltaproteobacteria bacterium]|nr:DUF1992 domain-containing protein [Deltaproteobacteria bacterium]
MFIFQKIAEDKIRDAFERGEFAHLEERGKLSQKITTTHNRLNMKTFLNDILPRVSRPSRYLGSEVNSIHKKIDRMDVKVLLAFPDIYEVGMSHLGFQILYHILNI